MHMRICKVFFVSQTEAEANSANTMKANPTPLVNMLTYRLGLYSDLSGRVTLLGR